MKDEVKSRLDAMMSKYDERRAQAKARQERVESKRDAFLAAFQELAKTVIHPAMEEVGAELKRRGHDYAISTGQAHQVIMKVYPSGIPRSQFGDTSTPQITFIGDGDNEKVRVHESTMLPMSGGHAGSRSTLDAKQVSPEAVTMEIVAFLEQVFAGK